MLSYRLRSTIFPLFAKYSATYSLKRQLSSTTTTTHQAVFFAFCFFAGFQELLFNTGRCELNIVVL